MKPWPPDCVAGRLQLAMGWDAAGFTDAAAAALADDGADQDTLEQVAAARGLIMPP